MEYVESAITSKFQLTLPKEVRETLRVGQNEKVVFLIENSVVRLIKKPEDLIAAMGQLSGGKRFSEKELREEIKRDRMQW